MSAGKLRHALMGAATILGTLFASSAGYAAPPPGLSAENAAQLQKLLAVQLHSTAVRYTNGHAPRTPSDTFDRLFMWNEVALDTTAIDHTPVQPGENRKFGEQLGPTRASRAMAIANIAMFEAVDALHHDYQSYVGLAPVTGDVSTDSAIAQSMHDALVALYPSQQPRLDSILAEDVASIPGSTASIAAGRTLGASAAAAIVAKRENDGSQIPDPSVGGPYTLIGGVGHWSPDPVSGLTIYLGAYWGQVTPFGLSSGSQFRPPPPPALTDPAYTKAFRQVEAYGGTTKFGTPTIRSKEETFAGIFWSYDGTPALCAPPRLYNQLGRTVVLAQGMSRVPEAARFFAMINTAMADAAIAAWDAKYYYQFWRPVTAIRSRDQGGNTHVLVDAEWHPLGAQATNSRGVNFTPPFPAYISGHSTIGGSLFETLRHYYPDATKFTFTSDEWNGMNTDDNGRLRPDEPQTFASFTDAEHQNSESRIWLGVHWQFDADQGIIAGNKVADWDWDHIFQPVGVKSASR